jgi:hypothetical protein
MRAEGRSLRAIASALKKKEGISLSHEGVKRILRTS